jgi:hypothetical protein
MSYTCIEATSAEQLAAYKKTAVFHFAALSSINITEGVNRNGDIDEMDRPLDIHWILLEEDSPEDNVTLRINTQGIAAFWATGVEI